MTARGWTARESRRFRGIACAPDRLQVEWARAITATLASGRVSRNCAVAGRGQSKGSELRWFTAWHAVCAGARRGVVVRVLPAALCKWGRSRSRKGGSAEGGRTESENGRYDNWGTGSDRPASRQTRALIFPIVQCKMMQMQNEPREGPRQTKTRHLTAWGILLDALKSTSRIQLDKRTQKSEATI